ETADYYDEVGGPVQLGAFKVGASPEWVQPQFPRPSPTFGTIVNYDHTTNLAPPITPAVPGERLTLLSDSLFSDRTIFVDGNVFVNNWFYRCILRLKSDMPLYWRKNRCGSSYMTAPNSNIPVPLGQDCLPTSR